MQARQINTNFLWEIKRQIYHRVCCSELQNRLETQRCNNLWNYNFSLGFSWACKPKNLHIELLEQKLLVYGKQVLLGKMTQLKPKNVKFYTITGFSFQTP